MKTLKFKKHLLQLPLKLKNNVLILMMTSAGLIKIVAAGLSVMVLTIRV